MFWNNRTWTNIIFVIEVSVVHKYKRLQMVCSLKMHTEFSKAFFVLKPPSDFLCGPKVNYIYAREGIMSFPAPIPKHGIMCNVAYGISYKTNYICFENSEKI